MTAMSSKSIQDHIQSLSVEEQIDLLATLLDNTNSSEQTLTLAKSFLDAVGPERANELIEREDVWSILLGSYDRRMSSTTESKMTLRQKVEMVLGLGVVLLILMTPSLLFCLVFGSGYEPISSLDCGNFDDIGLDIWDILVNLDLPEFM